MALEYLPLLGLRTCVVGVSFGDSVNHETYEDVIATAGNKTKVADAFKKNKNIEFFWCALWRGDIPDDFIVVLKRNKLLRQARSVLTKGMSTFLLGVKPLFDWVQVTKDGRSRAQPTFLD